MAATCHSHLNLRLILVIYVKLNLAEYLTSWIILKSVLIFHLCIFLQCIYVYIFMNFTFTLSFEVESWNDHEKFAPYYYFTSF